MAERTTLLLVAGYVGALALVAYELQGTPPSLQAVSSEPSAMLPPLEIAPDAISQIADFDTILERPLFSRERRPDNSVAAGPASQQPAARPDNIKGWRLTAVLKGPGSLTALIEDQKGTTRTLHQGDALGNWQLKQIQDDRVVMESDGKRETLLVHRFDPVNIKKGTIQPRGTPTPRRQLIRRPTTTNPPRPTLAPREAEPVQNRP